METFTWIPSFGASKKLKPRVSVTRFGDGYAQINPFGISPLARRFDLSFNNRTTAEADAIETFISDNRGKFFLWLAPGDASATQWFCTEELTRTYGNYNNESFTLTFEEQGIYASPEVRDPFVWGWDDPSLWTFSDGAGITATLTATTISYSATAASETSTESYSRALPPNGRWRITSTLDHARNPPGRTPNLTSRRFFGCWLYESTSGAKAGVQALTKLDGGYIEHIYLEAGLQSAPASLATIDTASVSVPFQIDLLSDRVEVTLQGYAMQSISFASFNGKRPDAIYVEASKIDSATDAVQTGGLALPLTFAVL